MKLIKYIATFLFCVGLMASSPLFPSDQDTIIEAMTDEMQRSMNSLQIENMEKPYFLEYTIMENQAVTLHAAFGSLIDSGDDRSRRLRVGLRIGDYQLDNTGFMNRNSMIMMGGGSSSPMVLGNNYDAIRHDIWFITDRVYKGALKQLAAKRGFIKNQAEIDDIPDFSKEKSLKSIEPLITIQMDRKKWENTAKNLSAIFRKFPKINDSGIEMQAKVLHTYYVNSEGTVFRQSRPIVYLLAYASTQATDGAKLKHYIPFYAPSIETLPDEKKMTADITEMARQLTDLASAPVLEEYIGPVMFTGQASAELFAQLLAPHLSGERLPLIEEPRMAQLLPSSKLAQRLNRKILPTGISITDDPTITSFNKLPLIGTYKIDDQGVEAVPVNIVENGTLKNLLMSRRPRKEFSNSNGHARGDLSQKPGVFVSNLLITADKGKPYDELKKELMQKCNDQQLPFGLMVKSVDNPAITGAEMSLSSLMMRFNKGGSQLTPPVLLYKVDAKTGKEELVRGLTFNDIDEKSLKDIEAVGNDTILYHRLLQSGGLSGSFSFFRAKDDRGKGMPVSIVAPSVLFEELEMKQETVSKKNPPLFPHPFFR